MTVGVTRSEQAGGSYLHTWVFSADGDGDGISMPGAPDRTFQAVGTFGGGTLRFQGSLDGSTWFNLHDPSVTTIGLTAVGGGVVLENPLQLRPSLSGSTSPSLTVYLLSRSAK